MWGITDNFLGPWLRPLPVMICAILWNFPDLFYFIYSFYFLQFVMFSVNFFVFIDFYEIVCIVFWDSEVFYLGLYHCLWIFEPSGNPLLNCWNNCILRRRKESGKWKLDHVSNSNSVPTEGWDLYLKPTLWASRKFLLEGKWDLGDKENLRKHIRCLT